MKYWWVGKRDLTAAVFTTRVTLSVSRLVCSECASAISLIPSGKCRGFSSNLSPGAVGVREELRHWDYSICVREARICLRTRAHFAVFLQKASVWMPIHARLYVESCFLCLLFYARILESTYLWIISPDLELQSALHPWPGCISQLLTWEFWLVPWELLKTHPPSTWPVFLPSASESSAPIYANVDPPARAPQTDRKEATGKAPLYTGIGPVDESGIPVAIRTVSECCSRMLIFCFHIYTVQLRINIILWYYCLHFCHALKSQKQIIKQIIVSLTVCIHGGIFYKR